MSDSAETSDSSSSEAPETSLVEENSVSDSSEASNGSSPATPDKMSPAKQSAVAAKATKLGAVTHPATAVMVMAAITELKDRKGSSLPAIKKYLTANYDIDSAKFAPYIRKFLVAAVEDGRLVRTKGNGAKGYFKLSAELKKKTAPKKKRETKKATTGKESAPGPAEKQKKKPKSDDPAAKKTKPKSDDPVAKKTKKAVEPKPKPKKSPSKKQNLAKAKAKKSPVKKVQISKKN